MSKKLKVLGLALMAVCAFGAVSAVGAQAAPVFTVNGISSGNEALASTVTPTPAGADYTLVVPNLLKVTCKKAEIDNGHITVGTDEGTIESITFFECEVLQPNGEKTTCKVQGGTPAKNGEIHTLPVRVTLSTGPAGQHYVTFLEDPPSTLFVELKITECGLEGKTKITGTAVGAVLSSETLATNQEIEASEAIQNASGKSLLIGARKMFLIGKFDIHLASDRNWGVSGW